MSVFEKNTEDGSLKLSNGEKVPLISGVCTIQSLEVTDGYVGQHKVRVLRDTGYELAAVRRELVKDDQMLAKCCVMITIDGAAKAVRTARIKVDTPYYTGEIEAMVPNTLICDLVIGNIVGVRDSPDPDWQPPIGAQQQVVHADVTT